MKNFEVLEDNAGGLTMFVLNNDGKVEYAHDGYEFVKGQLTDDLKALKNGADPKHDWDGNFEDYNYCGVNDQKLYDQMPHGTGTEKICDNNGLYAEKMGNSGRREFGIKLD